MLHPAGDARGVRDKEIVADELHPFTKGTAQRLPARFVVLAHAVLEREKRIAPRKLLPIGRQLLACEDRAAFRQPVAVGACVVPRGNGGVEREVYVRAGAIARRLNGAAEQVERLLVACKRGGVAALVAHAAMADERAERVVNFRAHAQRVAEGVRADGDEHELLNVERVARVCAAVEHVHQRHRERAGVLTAEIPPERLSLARRRGAGRRERDGEDGVCAEPRFVFRAVQLAHGLVERALLPRVEAPQQLEYLVVDVRLRVQDALAAVARTVAVAQLDGLVRAGRGAGRHGGDAERAVLQPYLRFQRGVAAGIQDLASVNVYDGTVHRMTS